jgi:hypothetical protein
MASDLNVSLLETVTGSETEVSQAIYFYQYDIHIVSPLPAVKLGDCNISLVIPLPSLSITSTVDTFDLSLPIPLPILSVLGKVGEMGDIDIIVPFPTISVRGKPEVLGTIHLSIRAFPTLSVIGKTGELGKIAITLPFPDVALIDTPLVRGTISADLPFPFIDMYGDVIPITIMRKAIIMHLFNYAVSHYVNYNFNSLAHFNKVFLGANENGIYILDGGDDLGEKIEAEIGSGVSDLGGAGAISIPREAWLAYRSDGEMELDVKMDEHEDLPPITYDKIAHAIMEMRGKLGRGDKARFFTWKLKNVDGSDFSLESLRILGDIIKRKTR